ncbi:MAG: DUF1850 domain-containing protein [Deltaproteobacteria bacterium]|nr:DUF1850 domain-containing protein [Deltaproteobacteria bacterium]
MSLHGKYAVIIAILLLVTAWNRDNSFPAQRSGDFLLQVVKQPEETVLAEWTVTPGDRFFIDYVHSSDHTPIHDVFLIDEEGAIVLIEEAYDWYGAGLEFQSQADAAVVFDGTKTRVYLNRLFPHFLLRVGRVANHVITCHGRALPLKDIASGGSLVWIRVIDQ